MSRSPTWVRGAALAATVAAALGCAAVRDDERQTGVHPSGFADIEIAKDPTSAFHANYLRRPKGEDGPALPSLDECRDCHGKDFTGGAVAITCSGARCHTGRDVADRPVGSEQRPAVDACNDCHHSKTGVDAAGLADPRPDTPPHVGHSRWCNECHVVPKTVDDPGHRNGVKDVRFEGLPLTGGLTPTVSTPDAGTLTCKDTYCHGKGVETPNWRARETTLLKCDSCHATPPKPSHDRWARLTKGPTGGPSCAACHVAEYDPTDKILANASHLDGVLQFVPAKGCQTCHGGSSDGAPPPDLAGVSDPSKRGVGAHRRHLDATLGDRIGRVVSCDRCHVVPATVKAPGHLDGASLVRLGPTEKWDATAGSCVADCHWSKSPGPVWNDDSGAARKCDACHAFPPDRTRTGTAHARVAPDLAVCVVCHKYDPATHADGRVDFIP